MRKSTWLVFFSAAFLLLLFLVAIGVPFLKIPHPREQNLAMEYFGATWAHPLGLGENGVDILSNLLWATRLSLFVSFSSVFLSCSIGALLGALAGLKRGFVENLIMRFVDLFYAFPGILLVIALAAFVGPSVKNLIFVLAITGWPSYTRVARALVISLREREFIVAARSLGCSDFRIVLRHLFPNLLSPLMVQASYALGATILTESSLSFLGIGAPVDTPSWGQMLNQGREVMTTAPAVIFSPALALMATVLCFNLLGDGLRDFLDHKLK